MYFDTWLKQQNIIPVTSYAQWSPSKASAAEMIYNAVNADQLQKEIARQDKGSAGQTEHNNAMGPCKMFNRWASYKCATAGFTCGESPCQIAQHQ